MSCPYFRRTAWGGGGGAYLLTAKSGHAVIFKPGEEVFIVRARRVGNLWDSSREPALSPFHHGE